MKHSPFIASNNINLSFFVSSFAMALVLAFLGLFFVTSNDSMAEVTYWTDTEYLATKFVGSGTETDPYQITNAKELALVAYRVNNIEGYGSQCYSLENNISLVAPDKSGNQIVWEPIGTKKEPFSGVFWGNGHTISGMYINQTNGDYAGLFGKVSGTGKVEHIRVEGKITLSTSSSSVTCVGGVIAYWESNTPISKLTSDVNIVTKHASFVGGIVGGSYANIDQCFSLGEIKVIDSFGLADGGKIGGVGGIVGLIKKVSAESKPNIKNCFNKGNVSASFLHANAGGWGNVGGIVGHSDDGDTISDCYNIGKIVATCTNVNKNSYLTAGGIAGKLSSTKIENCFNKGMVKSTQDAGGIAGFFAGNNIHMIQCTNFASVESTGINSDDDAHTGGIVGNASGSGLLVGDIKLCTNYGEVKGIIQVGGIAGLLSDVGTTECHNKGNISGKSFVGGIVGKALNYQTPNSDFHIDECINIGKITGSGTDGKNDGYVGGIVGWSQHRIEYCMNMGDVTSESWLSIGGIAGHVYYGYNCFVLECINYGKVVSNFTYTKEAPNDIGVGGVVGNFAKDTREKVYRQIGYVSNCINAGLVSAPKYNKNCKNRYTGLLVGRNVDNYNEMKDCYVCVNSSTEVSTFGTNENKSINTSNGTPKRITGAEFNTISLSSSFKRYENPQNDYEKSCLQVLKKVMDNKINSLILIYSYSGLISIPDYTSNNNIPYDFEVGVDNSIWGFGNPNINNGQPYLKGWYWDGTSGGTSQKIEISYKVYLDGKESLSGTKTLEKGQSYTWQTFLEQAPAGYKYKEGGSGKSYSDTSVDIYFETIKYKLTVNYMDYTKNTTLEKSITEYIKRGDVVYLSDYNSKEIKEYKHFKTDCSATTNDRFAMKEDTTITVYYKKLVKWTITYTCGGKQVGDVVSGTDMVGTYISYNVPTGYELKYAATGMYVSESNPNIKIVVQKEGKKTIQVYYIENGKINYSKSKTIETQSGKTFGEAFEEAGISDWLDMCYYDFGDWFEKVKKNDIVKRDTDVYYYLS